MSDLKLILDTPDGEQTVVPLAAGTTVVITDDPGVLPPDVPVPEPGAIVEESFKDVFGSPWLSDESTDTVSFDHLNQLNLWTLTMKLGGMIVGRTTVGNQGALALRTVKDELARFTNPTSRRNSSTTPATARGSPARAPSSPCVT